MSREQVGIRTQDGTCRTAVFKPDGTGRWPAVIFYMDGLGIRPVLYDMCDRIARDGYVVLLPDLFYRAGSYEPLGPKAVFAMGDIRNALGHLFESTANRRPAPDPA